MYIYLFVKHVGKNKQHKASLIYPIIYETFNNNCYDKT